MYSCTDCRRPQVDVPNENSLPYPGVLADSFRINYFQVRSRMSSICYCCTCWLLMSVQQLYQPSLAIGLQLANATTHTTACADAAAVQGYLEAVMQAVQEDGVKVRQLFASSLSMLCTVLLTDKAWDAGVCLLRLVPAGQL